MSATIDVNKLERENSESLPDKSISDVYKQQQLLVEKYESAYRKFYLINFIVRLYWLILFSSLLILGIYSLNHPKVWEAIEPFTWIFFIIPVFVTSFIWSSSDFDIFSFYKSYRNEINKLENEIVKETLKKQFNSDQKLKDEIEDFYIELNNLTKAKYETALKFFKYESLAYIIISLILAVLLRFL